jgi:uncharacterized protein with PIN domain
VARAVFTFLPDLNDFLSPERRGAAFTCDFEYGQSVKHLIESSGVPHTEVGIIRAGGLPVDLDYLPRDGEAISVEPPIPGGGFVPAEPRFVLDNHLGRLSAYMRMMGFDCLYRNDFHDEELAALSAAEERILLTRDRRLLMRKIVRYGYCLRSLNSIEQAAEVLRRYDCAAAVVPFRRCLRCNHPLEQVTKEKVLDRLQTLTIMYYEEFHRCPSCGQIYWKGSHYERMARLVERLLSESQH